MGLLSREFVLSFVRYICETESGVMCLDFHPEHPNYIAVGFYDGKHICLGNIFSSMGTLICLCSLFN